MVRLSFRGLGLQSSVWVVKGDDIEAVNACKVTGVAGQERQTLRHSGGGDECVVGAGGWLATDATQGGGDGSEGTRGGRRTPTG